MIHVVEECPELDQWRPRRAVWIEWNEDLGGRVVSKKKKVAEKEGGILGAFFYRVYEFLFSFTNQPPVIHRPFVPARYVINFVPAVTAMLAFPFTSALLSPSSSTDYSVVSSVNFVRPSSPDHSVASSAPVISTSSIYSVVPSASSTGYSVISSANFVPAPSPCIGTN